MGNMPPTAKQPLSSVSCSTLLAQLACKQVTSSWSVAARMSDVSGVYIAAALVPAFLITMLFWFDHNVSSKMAQQEEFNLRKPGAYHWDFLVLSGLVGGPTHDDTWHCITGAVVPQGCLMGMKKHSICKHALAMQTWTFCNPTLLTCG